MSVIPSSTAKNFIPTHAVRPDVSDHAVQWRAVVGFEGRYEVSSAGQVRGIGRRSQRRPLALNEAKSGHLRVGLYISGRGRPKTVWVHQLVAEAFLGPRPDGQVACHNDGHPWNNDEQNIRYDTPAGNSADMVAHGTSLPGEANANAILDEDNVREIRRLRGLPYRAIARHFGVSYSTIQKIMSGEGWRHVV